MAEVVEELLSSGEVAARVGYSLSGLRRLERVGVIPAPARMVGSNRRVYRGADVAVISEIVNKRRADLSGSERTAA